MGTRPPLPLSFRSPPVALEQAVWCSFTSLCMSFLCVFSIALIAHGLWRLFEKPNGPLEDALGIYMGSLFLGLPIAAVLTAPVAALVMNRLAGLLSVATICVVGAGWIVTIGISEPPQPNAWPLLGIATFLWPYPLLSWLFFWSGNRQRTNTPIKQTGQ